jgi:hypothetical protein
MEKHLFKFKWVDICEKFISRFIYSGLVKDVKEKYNNIWKDEIKTISNFEKKESYNLNDKGFRVYRQEKNKKFIACFGGEETFGLHLKDEKTWPYILSQKLNKFVKNYGEIGGSSDTIARYIWQYLQYEKPEAIFIIFSDIKRFEFYTEKENKIVVNLSPEEHSDIEDHTYYFIKQTNNMIYKFLQNLLLIKLICKKNNIPFYWYTTSKDLLNTDFSNFRSYRNFGKIVNKNNTFLIDNNLEDFNIDFNDRSDVNEKIANIFFNKLCK